MEDNKLKFVVHGRKEGDKFVLEGITNYILQSRFYLDLLIVPFPLNMVWLFCCCRDSCCRHHSLNISII